LLAATPLLLGVFPLGLGHQPTTPPCTITWNGVQGASDWRSGANWEPPRLPTDGDVVCIPAGVDVVHGNMTDSIAVLLDDGGLTLSGGTLEVTDVANDSRIVKFMQTGGTLSGAATVVLTGSGANASTWSGGMMAGSGTTRVASGATLVSNGFNTLAMGRSLDIFGTVTHPAQAIFRSGVPAPVIWVEPGGLWNMTGDVAINADVHVLEAGVLRKSGGSASSSLSVQTSNEGTVEGLSGTLLFPGGLKTATAQHVFRKDPTVLVTKAIEGMLPKNPLGNHMAKKLRVYAGPTHPHQAQGPEPITL
jgi:hypothetical protein